MRAVSDPEMHGHVKGNPTPAARSWPRWRWGLLPGSIQGTLILLLLVILVPLLAVQALIYYRSFETRAYSEFENNIEVARAVATTFDTYIEDLLHQEHTVGLAAAHMLPQRPDATRQLLSEVIRAYPTISVISWLDAEGSVVVSSDPSLEGVSMKASPCYAGITGGKDTVVGDLQADRATPADGAAPADKTSTAYFHVARAIRGQNGDLLGLLVARVHPEQLTGVLGLQRVGTASVSIIDREGLLVYRYPPVDIDWRERQQAAAWPGIEKALAGVEHSGSFRLPPEPGLQIAAYVPVRSTGWVAVASRSQQEALAPVFGDLWRNFGLSLATAIVAVFVATIIARQLTHPMAELRKHALAVGRGELTHRAPLSGPAELGELAEAFNSMSEEIQARDAETRRHIAELRATQAALEASEKRYRSIIEQTHSGIWTVDAQGRTSFINERGARMLGYTAAEMSGRHTTEFLFPEDVPSGLQWLEEQRQGIASQSEKRFRRKDGSELWVHSSTTPINDDAGTYLGAQFIFIDTSDQRKTQEALRLSEERFSKAFHLSPVAISISSLEEGLYLDANEAFLRLVGRQRDEVIGHGSVELGLWEPAQRAEIARLIKERQSLHDVPRRFFSRTGELREAVSSMVAIDLGGQQCILAMLYDVTERNRAERAQRFLAEATRQLYSSLDSGTILQMLARLAVPSIADWCTVDSVAENGAVGLAAILHIDPAKEELARELYSLHPPGANGPRAYSMVLQTGQPVLIHEVTENLLKQAARDGQYLEMIQAMGARSLMIVPLPTRERVIGVMTLAITESPRLYGRSDLVLAQELARRCGVALDNARLYHQAQEAIAHRDEFLSVAAHELKTPITSLRGFAQLILRQIERGTPLDPARLRKALETIDQQSDKLTRLVTQLLDVSRIEAGKLNLEWQLADISAIVQGAVEVARSSTSEHTFSVSVPDSLPALIDPLRLEQVLANLLDNAIKYSPEGRPIEVGLASFDGKVEVSVTDHGIGISPEHREGIFDRFYQAHPGRYIGGMGLGLYISQQIVQLHGGKIRVEGVLGGGSKFVVELPIELVQKVADAPLPVASDAENPRQHSPHNGPASGNSRREGAV